METPPISPAECQRTEEAVKPVTSVAREEGTSVPPAVEVNIQYKQVFAWNVGGVLSLGASFEPRLCLLISPAGEIALDGFDIGFSALAANFKACWGVGHYEVRLF